MLFLQNVLEVLSISNNEYTTKIRQAFLDNRKIAFSSAEKENHLRLPCSFSNKNYWVSIYFLSAICHFDGVSKESRKKSTFFSGQATEALPSSPPPLLVAGH